MRQAQTVHTCDTSGPGLYDITSAARTFVAQAAIVQGLMTCFVRHTSASLLIQENADPDVGGDLETYFERIAPEEPGRYVHDAEGPDDMPAHIRAALTQVHLSIPVASGRLALGTWQGIYLFEHRRARHRREVVLHLIGE